MARQAFSGRSRCQPIFLGIVGSLAGVALLGSYAAALVAPLSAAPRDEADSVSASSWNVPARGERLRARESVRVELVALERLLAGRADETLAARSWRLPELSRQLTRDNPELAVLDSILAAQTGQRAGNLQPQLNKLRQSIAVWRAWSEPADEFWEAARRGATVLARFSRRDEAPSAAEELELRQAFAAVARTRRCPDWTEAWRRRYSRPNQRLSVRGDYLVATTTRRSTLPLDAAVLARTFDVGDAGQIAGSGHVVAHSTIRLRDDPEAAAFVLSVDGAGAADWTGRRRQTTLWAHSDVWLSSQQSLRLTPLGCELATPEIGVTSATELRDLERSARCSLPGRPWERLLERRFAARLPSAEAAADVAVAATLRTRVEDEGHDLAGRLQSVCLAAFWGPLAASDLESQAHVHSTAQGVEWTAEYARPEQLGAFDDPPAPADGPPSDTRLAVHVSALQHLAERWSGRQLDEVAWLDVLREQLKLTSHDWEALSVARRAAALQIAPREEIGFDVRDGRFALRVPLCGVELDGERVELPVTWVRAVYRLHLAPRGWQLVREACAGAEAAGLDPRVATVVARFLPTELHPAARFPNAAISSAMELSEIRLERGWIVLGTRRAARTTSVPPSDSPRTAGPPSSPSSPPSPAPSSPLSPTRLTESDSSPVDLRAAQLLYCFQGKGSCLPYDAGVLHECFLRLPALREQRTIVAGNSSGSIPAAFFGCHGMSPDTVRQAIDRLLAGDREAVRSMENPQSKMSKLLAGRPTEIPHSVLREYIAFALGVERWQDASTVEEVVRRSTARPRFPVLIVACNREVLDNRPRESERVPGDLKELDHDTLTVSWRPDVHAYYRQHPEQFAHDHPDLVLGEERRIGHAVTYFVDASLFELLRQIPPEERQADLRLMVDAPDVALAILASVSEPTYFDPVEEPRPERILSQRELGDLTGVRRRSYFGGYIVALPAQDLRRMLPGLHVLGTGWRHNTLPARRLLRDWLLADVEPVAQQAEWWVDLALNPDAEFRSHMDFRDLTAEEEFQFGVRRAREGLDANRGSPEFVLPPRFLTAAARAWWPAGAPTDEVQAGDGPAEKRALRTLRGLGSLIGERPAGP